MTDPIEIQTSIDLPTVLEEDGQRLLEITARELEITMVEASLLMEREVKENTPVGIGGGGGLKGSVSAKPVQMSGQKISVGVSSSASHAVPVELGTRPHMPPVEPLADWAEQKLGIEPGRAQSVGYLIARKIAAKGTEGAHMFERAFNDNEGQVKDMFDAAAARIVAKMGGAA